MLGPDGAINDPRVRSVGYYGDAEHFAHRIIASRFANDFRLSLVAGTPGYADVPVQLSVAVSSTLSKLIWEHD